MLLSDSQWERNNEEKQKHNFFIVMYQKISSLSFSIHNNQYSDHCFDMFVLMNFPIGLMNYYFNKQQVCCHWLPWKTSPKISMTLTWIIKNSPFSHHCENNKISNYIFTPIAPLQTNKYIKNTFIANSIKTKQTWKYFIWMAYGRL